MTKTFGTTYDLNADLKTANVLICILKEYLSEDGMKNHGNKRFSKREVNCKALFMRSNS